MKSVYKFLLEAIRSVSQLEVIAKPGAALSTLVLLVLQAWEGHFVTKHYFVKIASRRAFRPKTKWDDFLVNRKFFSNLSHIVPALILYHAAGFSFPEINQNISELSDDTVEILSKDFFFHLTGFLVIIA